MTMTYTFAEVGCKVKHADDWLGHNPECNSSEYITERRYWTYPTSPFPIPLKKPIAPSLSAPSIGFSCSESHVRCQSDTILVEQPHHYTLHPTGYTVCECFCACSDAVSGVEISRSIELAFLDLDAHMACRGLFRR